MMHQLFVCVRIIVNIAKNVLNKKIKIITSLIKKPTKLSPLKKQ